MKPKDKEKLEFCAERALLDDAPKQQCVWCKESSIFVEEVDISYRNANIEPTFIKLCVDCYEEMTDRMDAQWDEYYGSVL